AIFRIDRIEPAIPNLHPPDVVSDRRYLPSLEMRGANKHGKIRFATRARERSALIMLSAFGRFHTEDQHVLCHPSLCARQIRTDAQGETFFTQQNVAAITRADRNNRVVLWKMADEAPLRVHIQQ